MNHEKNIRRIDKNCRPAVVLVAALVILVALSTIVYSLYARMSAQKHRDQYMVDYTQARYAADSGLKYALTFMEIKKNSLISRPNEPDFSDVFHLSEEQYEQLIEEWIMKKGIPADDNDVSDVNDVNDTSEIYDVNEPNTTMDFVQMMLGETDSNAFIIRGPYGPPWPLIAEKMSFGVGPAQVRIEIHDENAKMPITWALLEDKEFSQEAEAAFKTFCEWMEMDAPQIRELEKQIKDIYEIKRFNFFAKPVSTTTTTAQAGGRGHPDKPSNPTKQTSFPHTIDWARLFHSNLLDTEVLAVPVIDTRDRQESALKYLALWGSEKVNVNTAPRHVLEAAFTFGGDADKIAEQIIEKRKIRPFSNITDLKTRLLSFSDSITKAEQCITTTSNFFTIRVTANSGSARALTVAAITKEGEKVQRIAVIAE